MYMTCIACTHLLLLVSSLLKGLISWLSVLLGAATAELPRPATAKCPRHQDTLGTRWVHSRTLKCTQTHTLLHACVCLHHSLFNICLPSAPRHQDTLGTRCVQSRTPDCTQTHTQLHACVCLHHSLFNICLPSAPRHQDTLGTRCVQSRTLNCTQTHTQLHECMC